MEANDNKQARQSEHTLLEAMEYFGLIGWAPGAWRTDADDAPELHIPQRSLVSNLACNAHGAHVGTAGGQQRGEARGRRFYPEEVGRDARGHGEAQGNKPSLPDVPRAAVYLWLSRQFLQCRTAWQLRQRRMDFSLAASSSDWRVVK